MKEFSVLLVDDNKDFLESVAGFLRAQSDIEIVGLAYSGLEALAMVDLLNPDLVLLDWTMPGISGLEVAQRIKSCLTYQCPPRVIMLTLHDTVEHRCAAAEYADGFVAKTELAHSLLPVIQEVFQSAISVALSPIAGKLEPKLQGLKDLSKGSQLVNQPNAHFYSGRRASQM